MYRQSATRLRPARRLAIVPQGFEHHDVRDTHAWAATIMHLDTQGLPAIVPVEALQNLWVAGLGKITARASVGGAA